MTRTWTFRAAMASAVALSAASLLAKNNKVAAPTAQPSASADAPETLETLGDRRLLNELASRGLDSLLDRYFDLHKTPDNEQRAIRSTEALRDLSDPKITNSEKARKVSQIVTGLTALLPNMRDPFALQDDAALLLQYGVTRDANTLEYWGANPATEARLRPVAEAVYNMMGKAGREASAQAAILAAKMNNQNQNQLSPQWDKLDTLSKNMEYRQNMFAYFLALALPKAERADVVDKALKYLADVDNADSSVMPLVHLTMGKLDLVAGRYDDAIKYLDAVATSDKTIQPPPDAGQIYQARYFENVAKLQAGKIPEAQKGLEELIAWQKKEMPSDKETQDGIAAAAEMLRYRIFLAEAAQTRDPAAKKKAEDNATAVLLQLSKDRPALRGIIYQQLVERLSPTAPVKNMDPLLLQGLMSKAYSESTKPNSAAMDQSILQRGLNAAQEMAARKGDSNITPAMKDEATRLIPVLLESMNKKLDAAEAFLAYAKDNANTHFQNAQDALEDAGRLTDELRRSNPQDAQVSELYDAFLPVAINPPFSKTKVAFAYGQRLAMHQKPREAIRYFKMVPKADRAYNSAQYAILRATQDLLNTPKLPESERHILANDLVAQAEKVRQTYSGSSENFARERAALATLIEAETQGADLKQPAEELKSLDGFEAAVKGTPDEKVLLTSVLLDRVNANVALNQLQQATTMLVALLNQSGGGQGAEFVRGLLDRLDKDLDKAQAAHDTKAMADIAHSEADLSGFLVNWAKDNKNPEIKKYTYQYMVFDARTKRLAGTLATDPSDRKRLLDLAMAAYKTLQAPENAAMFKATLDPAKVASGDLNPSDPDPNVLLGIGLTDFELKDYKGAADLLGNLLNSGKLGGATLLVADPTSGEQKIVDNDTYWEATYKLYASNVNSAKGANDPQLAATKQGLKNLLIRGGIPVKWQDDFEDLRKQIIPEFNVAALLSSPTSQPAGGATQPVSSR